MAKAELKTKANNANVEAFVNQIENIQKRKDAFLILDMMTRLTNVQPKMWGGSIVGYGDYHYKYASGREGDWFKIGFSPRKQNFSLYLMSGFQKTESILERLGKYKMGKGCLYVNKLSDINMDVLEELISFCLNDLKG